MNDPTETTETLHVRLAAQTAITDTREALLRTALALPNNLQCLADGGSFASTIVDLVVSARSTHAAICDNVDRVGAVSWQQGVRALPSRSAA